jgi:hypothetical protein
VKTVRYFIAIDGEIKPLEATDKLIQKVKWHKDETLKIEVWPFDLKIGPCTQVPYGKRQNTKRNWANEVLRNTAEYRREKAERPNQEPLIRLNEARTPYSEEFTKRDDARNRAYLSSRVSKGRRDSKNTSAQDDAPFLITEALELFGLWSSRNEGHVTFI